MWMYTFMFMHGCVMLVISGHWTPVLPGLISLTVSSAGYAQTVIQQCQGATINVRLPTDPTANQNLYWSWTCTSIHVGILICMQDTQVNHQELGEVEWLVNPATNLCIATGGTWVASKWLRSSMVNRWDRQFPTELPTCDTQGNSQHLHTRGLS